MMIPISVIMDVLKAYGPEGRFSDSDARYSSVSPFLNEELKDDTLYVGPGCTLINADDAASPGFVCIGEPPMTKGNVVVLPDSCDPHNVFNCLQKVFLRFSEYELKLMKTAIVGSYQELIDISYRFMSNPVLLYDSGYRILGLAPDLQVQGDREWEYMRALRMSSPDPSS
jgi:hypothetical protein